MITTSIIQRRDLEPLKVRAEEIVWHYEMAAGCIASVMGTNCSEEDFSQHPKINILCSLCIQCHKTASQMASLEYPCFCLHQNAAQEACKIGSSYGYSCPVGLYFWNSPFYARERYAGSLISSVIPALEMEKIMDKLFKVCKGTVSRAEIARHIEQIPAKTDEEIQVLTRMMQLCAERITLHGSGLDDSHFSCTDIDQDNPPVSVEMLDRERLMMASLRRGDSSEAQKMAEDMLKTQSGDVERLKLKAIELVILLSRNTVNDEDPTGAHNRYITKIMDSRTAREITDTLRLAVEQMTGRIFSFGGMRHASVLRKAERFIWENYTRKISLKEVADASGLSAPYFSTIFKEEMGENFSSYLNRMRVEKASAMLRETEHPVNKISAACGFEDQSWFSKIFKMYTGINPCKFRELDGTDLPQQGSRIYQEN